MRTLIIAIPALVALAATACGGPSYFENVKIQSTSAITCTEASAGGDWNCAGSVDLGLQITEDGEQSLTVSISGGPAFLNGARDGYLNGQETVQVTGVTQACVADPGGTHVSVSAELLYDSGDTYGDHQETDVVVACHPF